MRRLRFRCVADILPAVIASVPEDVVVVDWISDPTSSAFEMSPMFYTVIVESALFPHGEHWCEPTMVRDVNSTEVGWSWNIDFNRRVE